MSFFESIFYMAWRGIAIGLIISAPMGPVGMLCIQRTLDKGRRAGFYTGVGAAISDLFYALLTGFGLSFIEEFLERNQNVIQIVGSVVLIAFGIYLFRKNPSKGLKKPVEESVSVKKNILGGFLFTFSNPLILFLIIGLFARFNFLLPEFRLGQYFTGFVFIFVGALIWWWLITFSVDKVRSHFNLRSMWLMNRIIGSIIMLFAVVGIVTATTALASGADIRCWNAARGYSPFCAPGDSTSNRLTNPGPDTLTFLTATDTPDAVDFRCKVKSHNTYAPWGIVLKDKEGDTVLLSFRSTETDFDGISTAPALEVTAECSSGSGTSGLFADRTNILRKITKGLSGPDPTGSLNFYRTVAFNGTLTLFGGLHAPEKLLQIDIPKGFKADSIGFVLPPGASISPDELRLTAGSFKPGPLIWDDPELLGEYLGNSSDPMEGYLMMLDRSLEESLLRLGGDYLLASVKSGDGYDLIYISGARVNAEAWSPGMIKARLEPSGIDGVWNVEWRDAMHSPLSHEIKAQTDVNGVLTIQFPYQNSRLRLMQSAAPR